MGRWPSAAAVAVALLAGAAAPGAAAAATLRERAAAIDAPRVGAPVAGQAAIRFGRATVTPASGVAVRELLCGELRCGLVLDGRGRLVYRVEDPFSVPVAERNVSRTSDLKGRREGTVYVVEEALDGAVVWGWDLPPPELPSAAGGGAAAGVLATDTRAGAAEAEAAANRPATQPPAAGADASASSPATSPLPDWAARLLAGRRFAPPSHDLLAARDNGVAGLAYALLRGAGESLLLSVDPVAGEENLLRLWRVTDPGQTFRQGLRAVPLAAQPLGRDWRARVPPAAVATHTALRVENLAGEHLVLHAETRLRAQRAGLAVWQASLVDRAYDDDGGERRVSVREVRVDGRPAEFLHGDGQLVVALGRRLAVGDQVEVTVDYAGDLAIRLLGHSFWLLGTSPWYPRQELGGELGTLEITVDVPAPDVPFASGAEVARTDAAGRRRVTTRLLEPMQFGVVVAGKYQVVEETRDGLTARVAAYALPKEEAARELLAKLFSARRFFETFYEQPYPFPELAMVEINDWGFGQAPPGVIFFTREFFAPLAVDRRTRAYFQDVDARYLHEVAHGWWGHVVKMSSPEDTWIIEGFAEYTAALALWRLRGGEQGGYAFEELVRKWRRAASDIAPGASLFLLNRLALTDDRNAEDYWRLRYARGPLLVHAIRLELQRQKGGEAEGDRYFIAFLRAYLRENRLGWGTTEGLVKTLNELTGTDWQPWFERYVYGTEPPPLPAAGAATGP